MATELSQATDTRILDTRAMEWEPFTGIEGGAMKVLARDAEGNEMVMLFNMPPGDGPLKALPSMPYRHYHQSVHEYNYFMAGELPHWDYRTPEDPVGELVMWTEGYYLDRRPGPTGIHGIETTPTSPVGSMVLSWRTGTGNFASEPDFHEESREIAYPSSKSTVASVPLVAPADGSGLVYSTDVVDILDTRAMEWEPMSELEGAFVKVLSRDAGEIITMIVWMPLGTSALLTTDAGRAGTSFAENLFVLAGDLPHIAEGSDEVTYLPQGTYIERKNAPSGALRERSTGVEPPLGCAVLVWRSNGW